MLKRQGAGHAIVLATVAFNGVLGALPQFFLGRMTVVRIFGSRGYLNYESGLIKLAAFRLWCEFYETAT